MSDGGRKRLSSWKAPKLTGKATLNGSGCCESKFNRFLSILCSARETNGSSHEPVILKAAMEKKHTLEDGGKRSSVRTWKNVFVVLRSETLTFFSSAEDFESSRSPVLTLLLRELSIQAFNTYAKKKFVFALGTERGAEHLLQASSEPEFAEWTRHLAINARSFLSDEDNGKVLPKEKKNSMINKLLSRK